MGSKTKTEPAVKQKRQKKEKSEYAKDQQKFRAAAPRHVHPCEAYMPEKDMAYVFRMAENLRQASNHTKGTMQKRLIQLHRTKKYRALQGEYKKAKEKAERLKDTEKESEYKAAEKERKRIASEMAAMQKTYALTFEDGKTEMSRCMATRKIPSVFVLSACEDIWDSVSSVLFGGSHKIHFRKYGDLPELRAKQPGRGIIPKLDEDGNIEVHMDGVKPFGLKVKKDDLFMAEELEKACSWIADKDGTESSAIRLWKDKGIITDTFRICYISLVCKKIRWRMRVYAHITLEADPLPKKNKEGDPRHDFTKRGDIGTDLGTQSIAVCTKEKVLLENIAERGHKSTRESENHEAQLLRKMDRSRRATNPDNYYPDGRVKPWKERKPWVCSKNYVKLRYQYHELARRNADTRKYANQELANRIREMGDNLVIEKKNAAKLAKKAKESKVVEKPDGTKRNTRRKRFGKSVHHRCPGALQANLAKKFGPGHYHEVPDGYRASQYDHTADDYIKKGLGDRMFELSDGTPVQRDLYSAFLMMNHGAGYEAPDRKKCLAAFKEFVKHMGETIREIADGHLAVCNSGIAWKKTPEGEMELVNGLAGRIIAAA